MWSNFSLSLLSRHLSWYRYCLRPLASMPMAWMWPMGCGEIHTSVHAGGMARSRIRASVSGSVTRLPSGAT